MNIDFYHNLQKELKIKNCLLIAVSKLQPISSIKTLYDLGHKNFGENYVQELIEKHNALPQDIVWHFIGTLQSKKVKYIAPFVEYIHGVDNIKLLNEIQKHAKKNNRTINVLIQIKIGMEDTKTGGVLLENANTFFSSIVEFIPSYSNVNIVGLMGMASFVDDAEQIKNEFKVLNKCFLSTKKTYFINNNNFKELSIGMSSDYPLALAEGSTMVRIGTSIFGYRKIVNIKK